MFNTNLYLLQFQDTYPFHEAVVQGEWVAGENAGGRMGKKTYVNNPQYVCTINDDKADEDGMASCVINLLQKGARTKKGQGVENPFLKIGKCYVLVNSTAFNF